MTEKPNSAAIAAEAFDLRLSEFNAQVARREWVKPRQLWHLLEAQGVNIQMGTVHWYITDAADPLPALRVGGGDGHLWIRRSWFNDWIDRRGGELNGQKVGHI